MNYIKEILLKENRSVEDLINCFERIKEYGDIAMIKFDGAREENHYTIMIMFPVIKNRDMIRCDGSNLKDCMIHVLNTYILA